MSARMFKYQLSRTQQTDVLMAEGTLIRAVGMQDTYICLWAESPGGESPLLTRTFRVIGTGWDVPDDGTYLGTVFDVPFVWHVYEVTS